jgi:hypothetical protein
VNLAIEKGKAIAIENLKKLKRGTRGDGKATLRKILHNWNAKKFLQKLKEGSNVKGSGSSGSPSRLYINHRYAKRRYEEREKELRELIEKESNEYKINALKSELRNVEYAKKVLTHLIQSLQSESSSCKGANGRNPEQGRGIKTSSVAWQVLKVAFLFPILGKVLPRDLSLLKPVLVEGVWNRVRGRLVPLSVGGRSR